MAKKKKGSSDKKAKAAVVDSTEFPTAYIHLRTLLDGVEMGALRYTLTGDSSDERIKRAKRVAEKLEPLAKRIRKWLEQGQSASRALNAVAASDVGEPCPDGFFLCDGCCVPYPCPPGGIDS